MWISPERARWAREQRKVVGEWDDGSIAVELSFAGVDWLVREVLKEAGDAAVLEPRRRPRRGARGGGADRVNRREEIRMSEAELEAFLHEQRIVICATIGRDGWPHVMPLWYVVRDGDAVGLDLRGLAEGAQPRARPARDAAGRGRRALRGAARRDASRPRR